MSGPWKFWNPDRWTNNARSSYSSAEYSFRLGLGRTPWAYIFCTLFIIVFGFTQETFFSIILPYQLKGELGNIPSLAAVLLLLPASCQRYLRSLGSFYISLSQGLFKPKPKAFLIKEPFKTHGCLFYFSIIWVATLNSLEDLSPLLLLPSLTPSQSLSLPSSLPRPLFLSLSLSFYLPLPLYLFLSLST